MAKVIIKANDSAIRTMKSYTVNAGSLSCTFTDGASAPVDEKFAEKFMAHFGESFTVEPLKGKPAEPPKADEKI